jgi:hypothetical protein
MCASRVILLRVIANDIVLARISVVYVYKRNLLLQDN